MVKALNQRKSSTTATKAQNPDMDQPSEQEEIVPAGHDGIKIGLSPAYRTYLDARKSLAQAFKERERQDQEASRDAELRYQLCEEAINKAMKEREKAELDASDVYREDVDKAIDKASQTYKDTTKHALIECKQKIMDAWQSSMESSAEITDVCEEAIDKVMKEREKAELEALDVYRDDVDNAIEKASRTYKEKMKRALMECKQKVVDAWRGSMETSAKMTAVFEDNISMRKDEHAYNGRTEIPQLQFRKLTLFLKRKLFQNQ